MSKPTTTYTPAAKPTTGYNPAAKNATTFGVETGVTLDSLTVTLASLTVYLQGYTTDPPPSNKNRTSYTPL